MLFVLRPTSSWSLHFVSSSKCVRPDCQESLYASGSQHSKKTFEVQVFDTFLWQRFASSVASIFGRLLVNASPSLLAMRSQRILMSPSTHSKLVMLFYCYLYCNMSSCIVMFHIFTFGWNIAVSLKHCQGPMYLRVVRIQRISDVNFTTRQT